VKSKDANMGFAIKLRIFLQQKMNQSCQYQVPDGVVNAAAPVSAKSG
jgi:hypothetical protein